MKAKPTNWHELLQLAKVMFESGKHQTDLREKFGDVRGQKLFYLLVLNQAFPNVKLFELTDKEIMQLHFAKLIRLGNRTCPDSLSRIQRQDATDGREPTKALTESEFKAWINEQLGRPQRPDRRTKEELAAEETAALNKQVKLTMEGLLADLRQCSTRINEWCDQNTIDLHHRLINQIIAHM